MNLKLKNDFSFFFIGIAVFTYVVLRAIFVPPYSDELKSFFDYIQTGSFQPFHAHLDANNHIINSLFSRFFYLVFGDCIFILRLPNVLCFPIYLFYVWKIKTIFQSKFIGFCWFITMIAPLYFLEFFSLARGYGMSMAFLMGALHYLIRYSSTGKAKYLWSGLFMTSLALWSNLSLMLVALLLGGIYLILYMKNTFSQRVYNLIPVNIIVILMLFIIPLFYAVKYSFALKNAGELYYGTNDGFIHSVPYHLTWLFSDLYRHANKIFLFLFSILLIASFYAIIVKRANKTFLIFQSLLWGTVAGTILLHHFMDVNYPQGRTALHFFVLFMAAFFFSLDLVNLKAALIFPAITTLLISVHSIRTMNINYAPCWKDETIPISFYNHLLKWQQNMKSLPTISAYGFLGKDLDYYAFQNESKLNSVSEDTSSTNKVADFLIVNLWCPWEITGYDTLEYSNETKVALMKRNKFVVWEIFSVHTLDSSNSSDEFIPIVEVPAEQFLNHPFCFDISFDVQSNRFPFLGWLITEVRSSSDEKLSYNSIDLQRVKPDVRKASYIHCKHYVSIILPDSKSIRVYFYNFKKREINISNLKITLFKGNEK